MAGEAPKYRIIEKLGAGGMAEIYRAEVESISGFKKTVAIKRILPGLTKNEKFVTMFLDEARLCLRLNHANIVQVFDVGQAASTYFLVMELVDGLNLRQVAEAMRRQRRRLPVEYALYLGMEIAKGLAYAHDLHDTETGKPLGIVHRDVTPPNVLLSKMGEVKLTDFGLAKAAVHVGDTEPGVVKGKFSYLSPEAAMGAEVDARSDVFSCGVLLFEMLTGKRLFYGESDWQTVELVRATHIPSMVALNPDIAEELEAVVRRALARDPEARFQSAADLGDALAQHLFARGMKVTSRDIARLVGECAADSKRDKRPAASGLAQAIIEEEIRLFTSIEGEGEGEHRTASMVEPGPTARFSTGELIDTSDWAREIAPTTIPPLPPPRAKVAATPPAAPPPNRPATPPQPLPQGEGLSPPVVRDQAGEAPTPRWVVLVAAIAVAVGLMMAGLLALR
ncbi:MAG: serine/threonine-protein kinase [Myxococcota bacterium]